MFLFSPKWSKNSNNTHHLSSLLIFDGLSEEYFSQIHTFNRRYTSLDYVSGLHKLWPYLGVQNTYTALYSNLVHKSHKPLHKALLTKFTYSGTKLATELFRPLQQAAHVFLSITIVTQLPTRHGALILAFFQYFFLLSQSPIDVFFLIRLVLLVASLRRT